MELGVKLRLRDDLAEFETLAQVAEHLGFDAISVGEAYGLDAVTQLTVLAQMTTRPRIVSAILQIPARTPAATAMATAALDRISGGRFVLGLGLSGKLVWESWHGLSYSRPLQTTSEYLSIVRQTLRRERVAHQGERYQIPTDPTSQRLVRMQVQPFRPDPPIWLAAMGPRNLELAGKIADGALAVFFAPEQADRWWGPIELGRGTREGFSLAVSTQVSLDDDADRAVDRLRGMYALYLGGMGPADGNPYTAHAARLGFEDSARRVQERYLSGERRDAEREVPASFIADTSLVGDVAAMAQQFRRFAAAGATSVFVEPRGETLSQRIASLEAVIDAHNAWDHAGGLQGP